MEDDDRPFPSGSLRHDAASLLASESLDRYSLDELDLRITQLEGEIARVSAHKARSSAQRLAADALFRPKSA